MTSYHINPESLEPGACRAKSPASCKFNSNDNPNEHYDTFEDANAVAEQALADKYGYLTDVSSKQQTNVRVSVEDDPTYANLRGAWPQVEGTRIKLHETGQILTVSIRSFGRTVRGVKKGYAVALDENGKEVSRYIPGLPYSVVSGPDTEEFAFELKRIEQHERVVKNEKKLQKGKTEIETVINNSIPISSKRVKLSSGLLVSNSGNTIPCFNIYGANADGSRSFRYTVSPDSKINLVGDYDSQIAKKVGLALHNDISPEQFQELFKDRASFEESSAQLDKTNSHIRQTYSDIT